MLADTSYIGNKDITMALENLKIELNQARQSITHISGREGIKDKKVESSDDKDYETIVLEHQEVETAMDC